MKLTNFNFGSKEGPNKLFGLEKYFLQILKNYPDIAFFQEILITTKLPKEIKESYYDFYSKNKLTLLKKEKFENIMISKDEFFEFHYRNIYIQAIFKETKENMLIINTHTPTLNKLHRDITIKHLDSIFNGETKIMFKEDREYKTIIIAGDFNTRLNSDKHLFNMKFLVSDSNSPTTVNRRTIDGIYFKQNHQQAQKFKSENIKLENDIFDHLYQLSEIEFPKEDLNQLQKLAFSIKRENLKESKINLEKEDDILAVKVLGEYRRVYVGPRGGFYYFSKSNNKIYFKESSKQVIVIKASQLEEKKEKEENKKENKIEKIKEIEKPIVIKKDKPLTKENEKSIEVILVSGKYQKVYTGIRGGKFYFTSSMNKVYIKI